MKLLAKKLFELKNDSWNSCIEEAWGSIVALEKISESNVMGFSNVFELDMVQPEAISEGISVKQEVSSKRLTQGFVIFDSGAPKGRIESGFTIFQTEALDKIAQTPDSQIVSGLIFSLNLPALLGKKYPKVQIIIRDFKSFTANKVSVEILYGDTTYMEEIEKKLTELGLIGKDVTDEPSYFYENMVEFKDLSPDLKMNLKPTPVRSASIRPSRRPRGR